MPITRRHFISTLLVGAVAFSTPTTLYAAQDPIYTGFLSSLAIRGYDPVGYFKDGKAVELADRSGRRPDIGRRLPQIVEFSSLLILEGKEVNFHLERRVS